MSIETLLSEIRDELKVLNAQIRFGRPSEGGLMDLSAAAQALGMSRTTLWRRIVAGQWPCYREGRLVRVDIEEIRRVMREAGAIGSGPISLDDVAPQRKARKETACRS